MSHAALKQDETPEQTAAMKASPQANDLPVGEILRRTRVHYKQSITQVEKTLRIPAIQLEAIEGGHYDQLPARVYAIGFVRSYAQYLGLNSDEIVRLFKTQSISTTISPDLHFPVSAEQSNLPSKWMIFGAIAALILIPVIWGQLTSTTEPAQSDIPVVSEEIKENFAIDTTASAPPPPNANVDIAPDFATTQTPAAPQLDAPVETVAAPTRKGITLTIIENSWVEIRNAAGKRLVSRVLKAGDQYFVPDIPGLKMSIGNAGGVEMSIDGKTLPSLGKAGTVVRNISLNADSLKALDKER